MKKIKNNDGIVLKPGQEWIAVHGHVSIRVIALDDGMVICRYPRRINEQKPDFHKFHTITKSHDGADLEQVRKDGWEVWVEGMDQPAIEDCKEIDLWTEDGWVWVERWNHGKDFDRNHTYRYKLKKVDHPAKPEYRLFEINWTESAHPHIRHGNPHAPVESPADVGRLTDCGYRIFGFTDKPAWTSENGFRIHPCDGIGNRKYAIGRLEK